MASLVKAKTQAAESESSEKRKALEQAQALKQKVEVYSKDGDQNLKEQLQDYKVNFLIYE